MAHPGLLIREVTPADRPAIGFALGHLSSRSRRLRYFTPVPRLRAQELDRLARADHWHHEALIAFSSGPRAPLGVAEYIRLEAFDVAEVAVAVADRWQHIGVGHALVEALGARAYAAGVRHFEASLLRENKAALALARALGRCTPIGEGSSVVQLRVDLG